MICASLLMIQCSSSVTEKTSNDDLKAFFGTYTGVSSNVVEGESSARDLSVTIKPKKEGEFTIEWTAVRFGADDEQKEMKTSIDFYHSPRAGIYTSAMRKDVFDNMVSYDPTRDDAEPYVWASLQDKTLTLRALYILETGEYEMHIYRRTLTPGGLALEFERTRNRDLMTQVTAMLKREE